jgi:hypothetical protein
MASDSRFLHTANRSNNNIIDSFCMACHTFVGASPRVSLLRLMERAHSCSQLPETRQKGKSEQRPLKKRSIGKSRS